MAQTWAPVWDMLWSRVMVARTGGTWTLISGGVLLASAWGAAAVGVPPSYRPVADALPELLALLVVLFAWRFRRSRVVIAAVVMALAGFLVKGPLAGVADDSLAWSVLGILLSANLGLLVLFGDGSVARPGVLLHVVAVVSQPVIAGWWILRGADLFGARAVAAVETLRTPQVSSLVFLIAAAFAVVAMLLRRDVFEISLLWVLACSAAVVHGGLGITGSMLVFSAAQLTLLLGLVEDGYRLAFIDQLTGLPGRRSLDEVLSTLGGKYALAMIDVDHFKRFNDRYGHETGDQALRMVAKCLRGVGGGGRAYRYGGEEFVVVFEGASVPEAAEHLEALREVIATRDFGIRAPNRPRKKPDKPSSRRASTVSAKVKVSIGLAGPTARRPEPVAVLRAADRALYRAKSGGRNRLVTV